MEARQRRLRNYNDPMTQKCIIGVQSVKYMPISKGGRKLSACPLPIVPKNGRTLWGKPSLSEYIHVFVTHAWMAHLNNLQMQVCTMYVFDFLVVNAMEQQDGAGAYSYYRTLKEQTCQFRWHCQRSECVVGDLTRTTSWHHMSKTL